MVLEMKVVIYVDINKHISGIVNTYSDLVYKLALARMLQWKERKERELIIII